MAQKVMKMTGASSLADIELAMATAAQAVRLDPKYLPFFQCMKKMLVEHQASAADIEEARRFLEENERADYGCAGK